MKAFLILVILASLGVIMAAALMWPTDTRDETPVARTMSLHEAAIHYPEDLAILLQEGRDTSELDEYGRTPLMMAVLFGKEASVGFLLEHGADPNIEGEKFGPPLPWAARTGRSEIGRLLVQHGANVEGTHASSLGRTALHWAAVNGDVELARALLDRGADVNASDTGMGGTALHHAVQRGRLEMIKLLLGRSADVDVPDGLGRTPLDFARRRADPEIVTLLETPPDPPARGTSAGADD